MTIYRLMSLLCFVIGIASPVMATTIYENRDIPLIDNRFRIDYGVDKATFLLYREKGSLPSILVRPDGSKIHSWQLPQNVQWLETNELDIVTIEHPVPGPWQAIAENRGRNRVRVLSDVVLNVEELPRKVFEGERIKLQAQLTNKGERIDLGVYIADALLKVGLVSAQRAEDESNPLANTELGSFYDNGKGMDEVPTDGIFTNELILDVPAGRYRMIVSTINEIFTRAYSQTLLVYPPPYVALLMPPEPGKSAELVVRADIDEIDPASLMIDGIVSDSLSTRAPFQIRMSGKEDRVNIPTPKTPGRYKVNADIFATTVSGRELVLKMPSKSFLVLEPPPPPVIIEPVSEPEPEPEKPASRWWVVLFVVIGVSFVAASLFGLIWWRKRRAFAKALAEARADEEGDKKEDMPSPREELPMDDPDLTLPKD
jgi:uncharacterized protein (TIGR03503 family)